MSRGGPWSPARTDLRDPGVVGGVAAAQRLGPRLGDADVGRMEIERVDGAVAALGDLRVPRRRDLVEAVGAVNDPGARPSRAAPSDRATSSVSSGRGTPTS